MHFFRRDANTFTPEQQALIDNNRRHTLALYRKLLGLPIEIDRPPTAQELPKQLTLGGEIPKYLRLCIRYQRIFQEQLPIEATVMGYAPGVKGVLGVSEEHETDKLGIQWLSPKKNKDLLRLLIQSSLDSLTNFFIKRGENTRKVNDAYKFPTVFIHNHPAVSDFMSKSKQTERRIRQEKWISGFNVLPLPSDTDLATSAVSAGLGISLIGSLPFNQEKNDIAVVAMLQTNRAPFQGNEQDRAEVRRKIEKQCNQIMKEMKNYTVDYLDWYYLVSAFAAIARQYGVELRYGWINAAGQVQLQNNPATLLLHYQNPLPGFLGEIDKMFGNTWEQQARNSS